MTARLESEDDPEEIAALYGFSVLKLPAKAIPEFEPGLMKAQGWKKPGRHKTSVTSRRPGFLDAILEILAAAITEDG